MNWKEFFKPTLKKVVVTLLIFIILSFIPLIKTAIRTQCLSGESCGMVISYMPTILCILCLFGIGCGSIKSSLLTGWIILIIELVIAYLISCLIFYWMNRSKKR